MHFEKEDPIKITFNYDLEKVYSAVKFVLSNSEDRWIRNYSGGIGYIEEKTIMLNIGNRRDIEIYFNHLGEQGTKVKFVITQLFQAKMAGKRLIDELQYYLEYGEEAFKKYTKSNALKRRVRAIF